MSRAAFQAIRTDETRRGISRRWLLLGGAAGLLAVAATVRPIYRTLASRWTGLDLEPQELNALLNSDEVAGIGASLSNHDAMPDIDRLVADLVKTAVANGSGAHPGGSMRQALRAAVASEFREGDIVLGDGWVLARTEARQCQLQWRLAR